MTEKEFKKFLDSLADDTDRDYAIDAWDSMVASERAECTVEDMEGYIEDTYKAVEEQKLRDVPSDKIFVAVLDDGYYSEHGNYPEEFDSDLAYEGFEFDTPEEFVAKWQELEDGAWYWVFDKGELFCSGAIDPNDLEIFEEHWDRSFDELEPDLDLPESVTISASTLALDTDDMYDVEDELGEIVSDYLSDEYGFCHKGFDMQVHYNEFGEPSEVVVSNIQWDIDEEIEVEPKEYVITMSSGGGTVRDFLTCDSREEAEELCESYDWCFVDENAFEWSLDIDERDIVSLEEKIAAAKTEKVETNNKTINKDIER